MSKVALERVTSSFGFQAAFNDTLAKIESEFTDKVLYRDNPVGTTNEMKNDLDMGTHDVLNVKMVDAQQFRVGGVDLDDVVNQLIDDLNTIPAETMGYRDEAIAARNAAQLAESGAQASEDAAQASALTASTKASEASASASQAAVSASNALAEKQLAALFAGNASQSATDSLGHANDAAASAAQALISQNASASAAISEANAASSASAASLSAIDADASEAAALGYKEDIIALFADYTLNGLHTHANKTTLDGTQESFTTALKTKLDGIAANANNYSLPIATPSVLGGVKDGTGVTVAGDGTLSVDFGSSSNTACMGNDARLARVFQTSLPTVVGNYTDIGNYNISNGAHNLLLALTCNGSGFSVAKFYNIVIQFGTVASCTVQPLMTTGAYTGNDFELELAITNSVVSLRVRRTAGTTGANIDVHLISVGSPTDAFTLTSGSGTSTASGVYTKSRIPLSSVEAATASRALASDANGKIVAATTTATELGYVNGVTSAIQTQLNSKASTNVATTSVNGLMSNTDKTKLDGIQTGAQVNANITKAEIEAKLIGVISTHSHSSAVSPNSITNTELADMAVSTIKGRATAGTGDPEDLTASQVRTILNVADGAQKNSDITKAEIEAKLTGTISTHTHNIDPFPIGSISFHASSTAPSGFLKCNGANVSRTTYADLFAIIGTAFGTGDGSTTFNLPDLRGEFVRGWDDGRGVDSGRALGAWQEDMLKSHRHQLNIFRNNSNSGGFAEDANSSGTQYQNYTEYEGGAETRPRNIALMACIKY